MTIGQSAPAPAEHGPAAAPAAGSGSTSKASDVNQSGASNTLDSTSVIMATLLNCAAVCADNASAVAFNATSSPEIQTDGPPQDSGNTDDSGNNSGGEQGNSDNSGSNSGKGLSNTDTSTTYSGDEQVNANIQGNISNGGLSYADVQGNNSNKGVSNTNNSENNSREGQINSDNSGNISGEGPVNADDSGNNSGGGQDNAGDSGTNSGGGQGNTGGQNGSGNNSGGEQVNTDTPGNTLTTGLSNTNTSVSASDEGQVNSNDSGNSSGEAQVNPDDSGNSSGGGQNNSGKQDEGGNNSGGGKGNSGGQDGAGGDTVPDAQLVEGSGAAISELMAKDNQSSYIGATAALDEGLAGISMNLTGIQGSQDMSVQAAYQQKVATNTQAATAMIGAGVDVVGGLAGGAMASKKGPDETRLESDQEGYQSTQTAIHSDRQTPSDETNRTHLGPSDAPKPGDLTDKGDENNAPERASDLTDKGDENNAPERASNLTDGGDENNAPERASLSGSPPPNTSNPDALSPDNRNDVQKTNDEQELLSTGKLTREGPGEVVNKNDTPDQVKVKNKAYSDRVQHTVNGIKNDATKAKDLESLDKISAQGLSSSNTALGNIIAQRTQTQQQITQLTGALGSSITQAGTLYAAPITQLAETLKAIASTLQAAEASGQSLTNQQATLMNIVQTLGNSSGLVSQMVRNQ